MLFKVISCSTNDLVSVYDVTYDSDGYPQFLVYKNGQWIRHSAKNYKPYYDNRNREV